MKRKINRDKLIIVTGGAGFIGSSLIRHLNDHGFTNAVIVDDFGAGRKWQNLAGKQFAEIVPIFDLFDWLEGREDDIQAIVHLGANSSTVETDCDYLIDNNYRYSVDLAEYALEHELRFIYASSAATYGDGSQGFSDGLVDELRPLNMYGFSKLAFDQWVLRHGLLKEFVGLRYFNVFGPNETHKGRMASMVFHMFNQIREEGEVRLFKSGEQTRDFIYVKDAVALTASFLENNESGIYNIGSGVATTWNDLANMVFKAMNKKPNIKYIDMPKDLAHQYQNHTCADMRLDFKFTPLEKAVDDYVNTYLIPGELW